jgi:hypothetical protein
VLGHFIQQWLHDTDCFIGLHDRKVRIYFTSGGGGSSHADPDSSIFKDPESGFRGSGCYILHLQKYMLSYVNRFGLTFFEIIVKFQFEQLNLDPNSESKVNEDSSGSGSSSVRAQSLKLIL